jgi:hypothetical protein
MYVFFLLEKNTDTNKVQEYKYMICSVLEKTQIKKEKIEEQEMNDRIPVRFLCQAT